MQEVSYLTHYYYTIVSYMHGCWIWIHQDVSYFKLPRSELHAHLNNIISCPHIRCCHQEVSYFKLHHHELHAHIFLLCISSFPYFYVHGCWTWFHQAVSYFFINMSLRIAYSYFLTLHNYQHVHISMHLNDEFGSIRM